MTPARAAYILGRLDDARAEIVRLRAIAAEYADMLDPPGAPKCFEVKPEIVKAVAAAMRAGLAVK